MSKYIISLAALAGIFMATMIHAKDQSTETLGGAHLTPFKLAEKAQQLFPAELAAEVQDQIGTEIKKELSQDKDKSIATLFLADSFYNDLKTGKYEGVPTVTWNGFDTSNNRPTFFYDASNFAYVTAAGRRIVPQAMNTDGGSVPKALHSIGNFTPWNYGPAFIVHDWIFVAHKCNVTPDNNIDFEKSAQIMAEALKTLMETGFKNVDGQVQKFPKAEDTLYLMYLAVKSSFARKLWNDTENVQCR